MKEYRFIFPVQAVQYNGLNTDEIIEWGEGSIYKDDESRLGVVNPYGGGNFSARPGDWIVRMGPIEFAGSYFVYEDPHFLVTFDEDTK